MFANHRLAPLLFGTLFSVGATAADLDRVEAATTLRTWIVTADGIADRCVAAFPAIADRVRADLAGWKTRDRLAIDRAQVVRREALSMSARIVADADDQRRIEGLWSSMTDQRPDRPGEATQQRCEMYFEARAGGMLRQARPEVFEALEKER